MDITQLRYFLCTAHHLNYTKASEELFISRQALRQAIAAMEKEIGAPLFRNQRNKLSLTEFGEYLCLSGQDAVHAFDKMIQGIDRLSRRQLTLRVALSCSLLPFLFPDADGVLSRFRARYPHIQLSSAVLTNDQVIRGVEEGALDVGLALQMPHSRPGCSRRLIATFPVGIDFSVDFPLRREERLTVSQLVDYPCIGMGSLEVTMAPLWEACRDLGLSLNYQVCPNAIDAFYQIQHGLAIGFDIFYPEDFAPHTTSRPLEEFTWELSLLSWDRTPAREAGQLFSDFLACEFSHRQGNSSP